jgi:hypothetical protein
MIVWSMFHSNIDCRYTLTMLILGDHVIMFRKINRHNGMVPLTLYEIESTSAAREFERLKEKSIAASLHPLRPLDAIK